jgi:hypothetical protein
MREGVYAYDPLGPSNKRVTSSGIPVDSILRVKYIYPYASQFHNSDDCGYFAIYIAKRLKEYKAKSFRAADSIIQKEFGTSPDRSDVLKLKREFS